MSTNTKPRASTSRETLVAILGHAIGKAETDPTSIVQLYRNEAAALRDFLTAGAREGEEQGLDRDRLTEVLVAVEQGLAESRRQVTPENRAQMVLAAYDLLYP